MALLYYNRYPGRFDGSSADYPQGSFKNRSAPGAKDGSYLEKDWANDKEGFFQWLLKTANITANGNIDTALSSQYATALDTLYLRKAGTAADALKLGGQLPAYYATATSVSSKLDIVNAFGQSQTWQDVTGSRTGGVTYTNSTGKPIALWISGTGTTGVGCRIEVSIASGPSKTIAASYGTSALGGMIVVPPGATYTAAYVSVTSLNWLELR